MEKWKVHMILSKNVGLFEREYTVRGNISIVKGPFLLVLFRQNREYTFYLFKLTNALLVNFWWKLMSHFHTICHYDYIINVVINLVSFYKKKQWKSKDNKMMVASKHSSLNQINEHMKQTPIPGKWVL